MLVNKGECNMSQANVTSGGNNTGDVPKLTKKERKAQYQTMVKDNQSAYNRQAYGKLSKETKKTLPLFKLGRPKRITDEMKLEILERTTCGQNIKDMCLDLNISPVTLYKLLEEDSSFMNQFMHAKVRMADTLFEEMLSIADDDKDDLVEDKDGNKIVNHARIQRHRLMIETRFRIAGKLNPKRYSEKLTETANVTVNHNTLQINARDMNPNDRDKLRSLLLSAKQNVTLDSE